MFFEKVSYRDDLPFSVSFSNVVNENRHCHREIEIVMVLQGITHYKIYHSDYELNPGDLIIADVEDLHQIHDSSNDIIMLQIHIDTSRFQDEYPDIRYMFFVCEECMEAPASDEQLLHNKLAVLKSNLARLTMAYFSSEPDKSTEEESVNSLVSILVNHFQGFFMEDYQYKTSKSTMNEPELQRLCRITRYILTHYDQHISLQDVSDMEHLSTYYVSRLIKKTLGFNFQNFVNAIRLEFAEKQLVFTNLPLMQISENCGFSSSNYFNKCFSAWHGKTPSQYRKEYVPRKRSYGSSFSSARALDLLSAYLSAADESGSSSAVLSSKINFLPSGNAGSYDDCLSPVLMLSDLKQLLAFSRNRSAIDGIRPFPSQSPDP